MDENLKIINEYLEAKIKVYIKENSQEVINAVLTQITDAYMEGFFAGLEYNKGDDE